MVGASAGGVEALTKLVGRLPDDFAAPILVVLHVAPEGTSVLPKILARAGPLPAEHAEDRTPLEPGHIYVAPPDRHLAVEDGVMRVEVGPKENGHRPAIDRLFRSAAHAGRSQTIGLVLSGVLDDGSAGLRTVRAHGGIAIVQEPGDATYGGMPRRAIEYAHPDYVVPVDEMPALLARLMEAGGAPLSTTAPPERPGSPKGVVSGLTCPECNGALFESDDGTLLRFECRVGHAYTVDTLVVEQGAAVEAALWSGMRALEERAALARRLAERSELRGARRTSDYFLERASEAERHADTVRRMLETMQSTALPDDEAVA